MMHSPLARLPCATIALIALSSLWLPRPSHASTVCPPSAERAVLRLQIKNGPVLACDLQALESLPSREIATALPQALGMPGTFRWHGVSLRRLVELLGGNESHQIELTALNDYAVRIPWSDLAQYDPVLAYRRNHQQIGIRDKGPLILIYPFDQNPRLHRQDYINRTIWQVHVLSVR